MQATAGSHPLRPIMRPKETLWLLSSCVVCLMTQVPVTSGCGRGAVYMMNNEYRQMLIAISENVPEDPTLLDRIQYAFKQASQTLFSATKNRAFFGEITVLVPTSWGSNSMYVPVINETFDTSDIVIDVADTTVDEPHKPFTIKTTPCGELGSHMVLTPEYLLNQSIADGYGPYGKLLVHEWAHLRYGVYDEYATDNDGIHFYAASSGVIEATRCSSALTGSTYNPSSGGSCKEVNGQPEANCRFKDDDLAGTKYGSLMYKQFLDHVLRNHGDFADGINGPLDPGEYKEPTFQFVHAQTRRIVLVLDVSGSMQGSKIIRQNQGCSNYIASIMQDGQELGITQFSDTASTRIGMTEVSNTTRATLISKLPTVASGFTSIGIGIRQGLIVLRANGGNSSGAEMIIVSDGEENRDPRISTVWNEVMSSGVTVHTIAFTANADSAMDSLAQATGGLAFLYSDSSTSNALNEAFEAIGGLNQNALTSSYTLSSNAVTVSKTKPYHSSAVIDSALGKDTEFLFDYASNIEISLRDPKGTAYTKNSPECSEDSTFKTIRCLFTGMTEVGEWEYNVTSIDSGDQKLAVTVKSKSASTTDYPIIAQAFWGLHEMDLTLPGANIQRLYASVSKGYAAVLGAVVRAEVERPKPDTVTLTLLDNGAGPDLTKDDGIYSAYFTQFTKEGRYNVKVLVNSGPVTMVSPQHIVGVGASARTGRPRRDTATPSGDFQRSASGGVFSITKYAAIPYPPGQILDLRVNSVNMEARNISLMWTATGQELDVGAASRYEIRVSRSYGMTGGNYSILTQDDVTGNLTLPEPSGETEEFTVYIPRNNANYSDDGTYFFAVLAYGLSSRDASSEPSNVVSATFTSWEPEDDDPDVVNATITTWEPEDGDPNVVNATSTPWDPEDDGPNVGMIVGIVIGVLVLIALIALIIFIVMSKKKKKNEEFVSSMQVYDRSAKEKMAATKGQDNTSFHEKM